MTTVKTVAKLIEEGLQIIFAVAMISSKYERFCIANYDVKPMQHIRI